MVRGVKRADWCRCWIVGGGGGGGASILSETGLAVLVSFIVVSVGSGSVAGASGALEIGVIIHEGVAGVDDSHASVASGIKRCLVCVLTTIPELSL